jgi:hypothetical protein
LLFLVSNSSSKSCRCKRKMNGVCIFCFPKGNKRNPPLLVYDEIAALAFFLLHLELLSGHWKDGE